MIPNRRRLDRRHLAVPLVGLAVLVSVPVMAGADQGRGGRSDSSNGSKGSKSDESTTTSIEVVVTTVTVPSSSSDPTTTAVTTTVVAPSTTAGGGGPRRQLAAKLAELITKLEKSKVPAETRDALLTRLRAMRDAVLAGSTPSDADLRAVMRDLESALARPGSTTTTAVGSTVPGATSTTPTTTTTGSGKRFDPARTLERLDEWSAKVTGSKLPEADKATLLAAIERLRGLVAAGPVAPGELDLVKTAISRALDAHDDEADGTSTTAVDSTSSSAPETSQPPRPKGRAAVDAAIQTVSNSPLPEALKEQILGVLTEAKAIMDDPTLTPDQVAEQLRELHRAEQQRRLDEAAAKLVRFSEKIAILAFDSGTRPGAGEVLVEVEALLAEANTLLAVESPDIETVKAAWKLLHQARTTLQQFLETSAPA